MSPVYALRVHASRGDCLVEFASTKELDKAQGGQYRRVPASYAHQWVKQGGHHETGLWTDNGRIRYAAADPDGY